MNAIAEQPRKRRPRSCRNCGDVGHDRRQCTKVEVPDAAPSGDESDRRADDPLHQAAELRERIDALQIEIGEYERVRTDIDERIARDRAEVEIARQKIATLRRKSDT